MAKNKASSLRAQWLGERLRKHRNAAGYTLKEVATELQLAEPTLSRFESGTYRIRRPYIKDLINIYGVRNRIERDALVQLNEDAWRKDWWDGETDDLPMEFIDYTWLEARAAHICTYEPLLITGLLQTHDYAQAVIRAAYRIEQGGEPHNIARLVNLRMSRQAILDGSAGTSLSVIIEEAALHRPVGVGIADDILRLQLEHLIDRGRQNNITIQVIPTDTGWHAGAKGMFTYFEMPDPYPDVAYTETLTAQAFLEDDTKVARYSQAFADMQRRALSPKATMELFHSRIKEMVTCP